MAVHVMLPCKVRGSPAVPDNGSGQARHLFGAAQTKRSPPCLHTQHGTCGGALPRLP